MLNMKKTPVSTDKIVQLFSSKSVQEIFIIGAHILLSNVSIYSNLLPGQCLVYIVHIL